MKAVFIVYNQAQTEKVEYLFEKLDIRGFTRWTELTGRGSVDGPPHMSTHTWPEQNTARLALSVWVFMTVHSIWIGLSMGGRRRRPIT